MRNDSVPAHMRNSSLSSAAVASNASHNDCAQAPASLLAFDPEAVLCEWTQSDWDEWAAPATPLDLDELLF